VVFANRIVDTLLTIFDTLSRKQDLVRRGGGTLVGIARH
jgi:hypothetical protein